MEKVGTVSIIHLLMGNIHFLKTQPDKFPKLLQLGYFNAFKEDLYY